jgi:hypothetical protein
MTKHYCAIYDADIAKNFDRFSPLAQMAQPKEKIKRRCAGEHLLSKTKNEG